MSAAKPFPENNPKRAVASCTAIASGNAANVDHSMENPNAAPTCEYVPIPDGSSSAAPVIKPGPIR